MPLPMVHLSVAWNLDSNADGSYFIGSIAPDAINLRKNRTKNMKRYAHMMPRFVPMEQLDQADSEILKSNAIGLIKEYADTNNASFFRGYGIHILTDLFWAEAVYKPYLKKYNSAKDIAELSEDDTYYNDTDQCDLMLYNKMPWRKAVWSLMENAESFDVRDYITADEAEAWKIRTFNWFDRRDPDSYKGIKYIDLDIIEDFIEQTTDLIRELLK